MRKGFVLAYDSRGTKREVPAHFVGRFGYKETPTSKQAREPKTKADSAKDKE